MKINMTHGSGGKATAELIREVFSSKLGNENLNRMEDAAVLDLTGISGKMAYTTDSFVVTPLFFRGGDIGRLSVCGTVNDLLSMGATPQFLTAGFIIEEGLDFNDLERVAVSMAETLKESGTRIVAADTKVIEGRGGLYINTSGVGIIPAAIDFSAYNLKEGDDILVTGTLGDHHACILSHRMEIENEIMSDAAPLNEMVCLLMKHNIRIKAMRDITRGGLATILNELCDASGCAAQLSMGAIPVSESVSGLCGILGLDPLYMGNEGKLLIVVHKADREKALGLIRSASYGQNAAWIGSVEKGRGVTITTDTGSRRVLDVLYGEGLPRIC